MSISERRGERIPPLAEKITIKNLHLSTQNKRNILIDIGILASLAHTYEATVKSFEYL